MKQTKTRKRFTYFHYAFHCHIQRYFPTC